MSLDLADVIDDVRAELNSVTEDIFTDLCSLVVTESSPDGSGGTTETSSVVESSIPCKYEALTPAQRQLAGGTLTTQTHMITTGANEFTQAIRPDYQIVIEAHHDTPELTFENPLPLLGSMNAFVKVAAALQR